MMLLASYNNSRERERRRGREKERERQKKLIAKNTSGNYITSFMAYSSCILILC